MVLQAFPKGATIRFQIFEEKLMTCLDVGDGVVM